jgi:hypothetical protein
MVLGLYIFRTNILKDLALIDSVKNYDKLGICWFEIKKKKNVCDT